jgi:hypothetical protein
MGSLTSSLLASSADKTAQDADNLAKSQAQAKAAPDEAVAAKNAKTAKTAGSSTTPPAKKNPIEQGVKKLGGVIGSFHDGGTVPKTGKYMVHEGEEVIPAKRASEYRKVYLGRKSKKD